MSKECVPHGGHVSHQTTMTMILVIAFSGKTIAICNSHGRKKTKHNGDRGYMELLRDDVDEFNRQLDELRKFLKIKLPEKVTEDNINVDWFKPENLDTGKVQADPKFQAFRKAVTKPLWKNPNYWLPKQEE